MRFIVEMPVESRHNWSKKEKAVFRIEIADHRLTGSAYLMDDMCHQNIIGGADDCIGKGNRDADRLARLVRRWSGKCVPRDVEYEIVHILY